MRRGAGYILIPISGIRKFTKLFLANKTQEMISYLLIIAIAGICWGITGCTSLNYQNGVKRYQPENASVAIKALQPLASQGDAEAQFRLGSLYYQGLGVRQDYQEAASWLRKAAEQGHVFAQTTLGTFYAQGVQGVIEKDYPQALMWYIFAAAKGDGEAKVLRDDLVMKMTPAQIAEAQELARNFKPTAAYEKEINELKELAEKGDATAQFRLGLIYYGGQATPRNYVEALSWFKKAARQGNPFSQYNVGYMTERGEGTPRDYVEAAKYYRQAAEQGNQAAQYSLGYLYEKGQGVAQDEVQALMWYNLASIQGETKARAARDRVTVWMNPEQIAEAQRLAREFGKK